VSKPHLLYIAFFFPPSRASGVYRALATVKAFDNAGWDVTVITADERFFEDEIGSVDRSLVDLIPESVEVERVPFSFRSEAEVRDLRDVGWFKGNFPLLSSGVRRRLGSFTVALDVMRGRSALSFPMDDRYLSWIDPVVAKAKAIRRRKAFDHVLATGNPYSAFEAARLIAGIHGRPFTVDYRDPWAFDMRIGSLAKLSAPTFAAEARIIDQAYACIQVNDAIASAYANLYPEKAHKQHIVMNGYDEASIPDVVGPHNGPLTFGMLGTVTDLWPLGALFEAWHSRRKSLPPGSLLRLGGHLGYFPWSADPLLATFPDQSAGFEYVGPVPKTDVAGFYAGLDVVLVPLFGGPMVTAGKVLEVAALGTPIVCIQGRDGGARHFFEKHPLAIGVDPDPDAVGAALLEAATLARTTTVEERVSVRQSMAEYERQTAMNELVSIVAQAPELQANTVA